jgi:hypothetical protein
VAVLEEVGFRGDRRDVRPHEVADGRVLLRGVGGGQDLPGNRG